MIKVFTLLLLLIFIQAAFSQADYKFSLRGRTYPVSAVAEADAGYNFLLWGKRDSVLYGYFRPNMTYSEIGSYRNSSIAVDLFPISFFKLRAGYMREESSVLRTDINCSEVDCQGKIDHQFAEANLLLGARGYFTSLRYRLNASKRVDGNKPFIEYDTMIPMYQRRDDSQLFQLALGKKLNDNWNVLYASMYASSNKARGSSTAQYLMAMYQNGPWEIAVGPGAFRSSLLKWGFSSAAWVSWNGGESFSIKAK